ncbi:hypothetical protein PVK06_035895 [Gossypium arboreum]|uniref:Uncharacterized protein n=1 Tax=Gossypium arboreum TaxID=29729 RepID=A0ABR0NKD3_GOSAR|nr:hypothetical protein PVK06_035895 [Gossypium arboreum]
MQSDKVSVTVETQALAAFLRSSFFLRFLRGVFLEDPGMEWCDRPGYSPSFQCLFLSETAPATADGTMKEFGGWGLDLGMGSGRSRAEESREEEKERDIEDAIGLKCGSLGAIQLSSSS